MIRLAKGPGESNPADLGTKHVTEDTMIKHLTGVSCEFRDGRPDCSSKIISSTYATTTSSLSTSTSTITYTSAIPNKFSESRPGQRQTERNVMSAQQGVWTKGESGEWTRRDRGARALRGFQGCEAAGISIRQLQEYVVMNEHIGQVLPNVNPRGKSVKDPAFTARLNGPFDIVNRIGCKSSPQSILSVSVCHSSVRPSFSSTR